MHQLLYSRIVQLYQFPYKLGVYKGHKHGTAILADVFLEKVLS